MPGTAPRTRPRQAASPTPWRAEPAATRSGREIYQRFRDGLADPTCGRTAAPRWRTHFAAAPKRLADAQTTTCCRCSATSSMPCAKRSLPTEYALIPFVESGYKPGARSPAARPGCGR